MAESCSQDTTSSDDVLSQAILKLLDDHGGGWSFEEVARRFSESKLETVCAKLEERGLVNCSRAAGQIVTVFLRSPGKETLKGTGVAKMDKKSELCLRICYICVTVFAVVSVLVTPSVIVIRSCLGKPVPVGTVSGTFVSAIISGIALIIASSVFIPELRIRSIGDSLKAQLNRDLVDWQGRKGAEIDKKLDKLEYVTRDEMSRLDAHLSRAVGVLIENGGKDPVWAIGWLLRACLRYDKIENVSDYDDLRSELRQSLVACAEQLAPDDSPAEEEFIKAFVGKIESTRDQEEADSTFPLDKILRLLKDYFRFCRTRKDTISDEVKRSITPLAFLLALAVIEEKGWNANKLAEEVMRKLAQRPGEVNGRDEMKNDDLATAIKRAQNSLGKIIGHFKSDDFHTSEEKFGTDYLKNAED